MRLGSRVPPHGSAGLSDSLCENAPSSGKRELERGRPGGAGREQKGERAREHRHQHFPFQRRHLTFDFLPLEENSPPLSPGGAH